MIAICVGHSRGDGGAVSTDGTNEWRFNSDLGRRVLAILRDRDQDAILIDRYAQTGYGRAMQLLGQSLRSRNVTVAVELHFNSGDSTALGHEWLHWHSSVPGRALAQSLSRRMKEAFPQAKVRGLVPINPKSPRGVGFLRQTYCPSVICEPFFGSNKNEWEHYSDNIDRLALVIADGIDDWKGGER